MQADLQKYTEFVEAVTSKASNNLPDFVARLIELEKQNPDLNLPLLMTSAIGLSGEAGEFIEISKKLFFHGKEFTEETKQHAMKELGDIIWYWTNACRALGIDPNQVIQANVDKLSSRYPGGKFSIDASNFRAEDDI